MSEAREPVKVFFPCTGLGHEKRGFEAFTRECAEALRSRPDVSVTVFGGGGAMEAGERAVWNLPRASAAAAALAAAIGRDPYFVEQGTFFAGFLPALLSGSPDVIYFADLNLGNALWHLRELTGAKYRLLYYNGGPTTQPFTRCDVVQQVSPEHLDSALRRGERADRQVLLPHGVSIARDFREVTATEREGIRVALGVPARGALVLSVGALNCTHKRMDYVIREIAAMPERPHLLLLGAETDETSAVRGLAAEQLGDRCTIRTLPRAEVRNAYRAADLFVLGSLIEGFGIAQVEALDAGLPCVTHDSPTMAFVGGSVAHRVNCANVGALAGEAARMLAAGPADARARHDWVYSQFSWDRLAPRYVELFTAVAAGRQPTFADAAV